MTQPSQKHTTDIAIIGSGPGGYVAAIRAAQLGFAVTCIEKHKTFGGTCLNVGCIPSKALLESSHLFSDISHRAENLGIVVEKVKVDLKKMMAHKSQIVADNTKGIAYLFKKHGVHSITGVASLKSPDTVMVAGENSQKVQARKAIIIATGSSIIELPQLAAFDHNYICNSTDALSWNTIPPSLVIIGGGVIGLELGSVWQRLGSQVTVIEATNALISSCDASLSRFMKKSLEKLGITFHLSSSVSKISKPNKNQKTITLDYLDKQQKTHSISAHKVLVCVGRKANTQGLGCDKLGIKLTSSGHIQVDDGYATSVTGIYAIGDATPGLMLAHRAEEDAISLVESLAGMPLTDHRDLIAQVVYTWPEVASIGKTEKELKEANIPYNTGMFSLKANARAKIMGGDDGFVRLYSHKNTDALLGIHIASASASELIAELTLAMNFCASSEDIARTPHAHPSLSEAIKEAALAANERAIHG